MDPRTPVIVGGGQLNRRHDPLEPVDLMVEAARLAAADAGAPGLTEAIDSIRVVGLLSWRYRDPGLLVGERLGSAARHTVYTGDGGSHPQALVNDAAEDIAAGRCDVVLVTGAEAWRTRMALKKAGERPEWTRQGDEVRASETRAAVAMRDDTEVRAGLDRPAFVYPLIEQAIRISARRTMKEHRAEIAALWSRFSEVAATNPAAWSPRALTAEEIATPTPANRVISWPYTKLMNSNNSVEQGAAVLLCSAAAAQRFGVPRDRWVFPRSGSEAEDTARIAARGQLDGSPAIRFAARTALELAGLDLAEVGPVDLYSCFPSAVQVAASEIGLPLDDPARPLTVTGGLTFAGGPWNNYCTHAIAAMADAVRTTGRPGMLTANSGYLTKHSIGIYAATPGAFRRQSAQELVDSEPVTEVAEVYAGPARLEAWTVQFDRDGRPEVALAALRTPQGARTLARSCEDDVVRRLVEEEVDGLSATVNEDTTFVIAD